MVREAFYLHGLLFYDNRKAEWHIPHMPRAADSCVESKPRNIFCTLFPTILLHFHCFASSKKSWKINLQKTKKQKHSSCSETLMPLIMSPWGQFALQTVVQHKHIQYIKLYTNRVKNPSLSLFHGGKERET